MKLNLSIDILQEDKPKNNYHRHVILLYERRPQLLMDQIKKNYKQGFADKNGKSSRKPINVYNACTN